MISLAPAWSARRFALLLVAYVVGFLAADVLGLFVSGHGFDTSARETLSFELAFDFLFGLAVGGIWPLAFPALYYFLIMPFLKVVFNGGYSGITTYPIGEFAALGTLFVMLGIAANALLRTLRPRLQ